MNQTQTKSRREAGREAEDPERRVNLRFGKTDFLKLKIKAAREDMSLQELGTALILEWLQGDRRAQWFATLTPEEENILRAIIQFLRDPKISDPWNMKSALSRLGKQYVKMRE